MLHFSRPVIIWGNKIIIRGMGTIGSSSFYGIHRPWYIPKVNLTIVGNGQQAVEKFREKNFDLILMDVQMPELNGYQATKAIRRLEADNTTEKPIPIIAMTASLLKAQIGRCYRAGMDAYNQKPFKQEELINTLLDALATTPLETM